jgi:glutamate-1-semialdehyde 2,1-aminomutase
MPTGRARERNGPVSPRTADSTGALPRSTSLSEQLTRLVPGGAHTYAKGPDQYPYEMAPIIERGAGAHVWDVDGNEYIEYGSGLRAVALGHAHREVLDAVRAQLDRGANFARPSIVELQAAEAFLDTVPTAEMVKFTKNGSDATSAAIKLARAVTGRDLVAICRDQPFFSIDDWFIGTTPMDAGIPSQVSELTIAFPYGDLAATEQILHEYEGRVACLILETMTQQTPEPGYLAGLRDLAHRYGTLLVFDEMIVGFRLSASGGQGLFGVTPDLSTFGKALGNGFAVSALAGRRELMERGGHNHDQERVFLLSTTHGAETHALAAAIAVMRIYREQEVVGRLRDRGERIATGVAEVAAAAGVADRVVTRGHPANLVFATLDADGQASQAYRTLFMRQLLLGGVLSPSFVVSAALSDADIDRTLEVVGEACVVYRKALEAGDPSPWLGGRAVKPVFRRFA